MFTFWARKYIYFIIKFLIKPFIKFKLEFHENADLELLRRENLIYAIPEPSIAELVALYLCAQELGLQSPISYIKKGKLSRFIFLKPPKFDPIERKIKRLPIQNLKEVIESKEKNLKVIPVSFYWGKHPDKQKSFFKILFSQSWAASGPIKRFFKIIFHGRSLLIQFQGNLDLQEMMDNNKNSKENSIILTRYLRSLFRKAKKATLGPDLSHRTTLVNSLSRDIEVRKEINRLSNGNPKLKKKLKKKAYKYANEICSDINYPIIRLLMRGFNWFWNKRYEGINLNNLETIKKLSKDNSLVYVPCHRSHIDYCALQYILVENDLMVAQIAAGNNLNIPIIGRILRGGGAVFMRRAFASNSLYSTVFFRHMRSLMQRGNSIEFFPEGGRSRSGLTLAARTGLISMILRSYASLNMGNVKIIPVYIGYEKILEGETYRSEALGESKRGESIFDALKVLKDFNNYLGNAYINFGDPIDVEEFLGKEVGKDNFYIDSPLEKPDWLKETSNALGEEIMQNINSSVAVTSSSLFATALLTENTQSLNEQKVHSRINMFLELIDKSETYHNSWIPNKSSNDIINKTINLGLIKKEKVGSANIFKPSLNEIALLSFYKNNISHLFILYSAICESLRYSEELSKKEIARLVTLIYPFLKRDFHLYEKKGLTTLIEQTLNTLISMQLIEATDNNSIKKPSKNSVRYEDYLALSNVCEPTIKRFYIVMHTLWSNPLMNEGNLKKHCFNIAKHLEKIEGWPYPEFSDKTKFDQFLDKMLKERFIRQGEGGVLKVARITERVRQDYTNFFDEEFLECIQNYQIK